VFTVTAILMGFWTHEPLLGFWTHEPCVPTIVMGFNGLGSIGRAVRPQGADGFTILLGFNGLGYTGRVGDFPQIMFFIAGAYCHQTITSRIVVKFGSDVFTIRCHGDWIGVFMGWRLLIRKYNTIKPYFKIFFGFNKITKLRIARHPCRPAEVSLFQSIF